MTEFFYVFTPNTYLSQNLDAIQWLTVSKIYPPNCAFIVAALLRGERSGSVTGNMQNIVRNAADGNRRRSLSLKNKARFWNYRSDDQSICFFPNVFSTKASASACSRMQSLALGWKPATMLNIGSVRDFRSRSSAERVWRPARLLSGNSIWAIPEKLR